MSQVLSQEHSGFSFWCGDRFHDDESERFVARYVERGPISLEKLSLDEDLVNYTTKEGRTHDFSASDFLALLTSHIPNTYESITRYYGWYSCRKRGERAKAAVKEPNDSEEAPEVSLSSWARCIKRVYEINPLECRRCKGEMRIVAASQTSGLHLQYQIPLKQMSISETRSQIMMRKQRHYRARVSKIRGKPPELRSSGLITKNSRAPAQTAPLRNRSQRESGLK